MLSILIPIYNQNVVPLITELHRQCSKIGIPFEIVCFDDASEVKYLRKNRPLGSMPWVSYIELKENKGRAKIRNMLARNARYDYLLFLDGDSKIKHKSFIKNYLGHIQEKHKVIAGGRVYNTKPPKSQSKYLHWLYGSKRENPSLAKRNNDSYLYFHSNNFVIDRELFLDILFDTDIEGYGYEDLVLATELQNRNIPILHLDNPILHRGLESTEVFLSKQRNAITNLILLHKEKKILETRLIKLYTKLKNYHLLSLFKLWYHYKADNIQANLNSANPSLRYLDAYKLNLLTKGMKSNNNLY